MNIDFDKYPDGLVPAIIQDADTGCVLMLGFMNAEALAKTQEIKRVTFYSRSKKRLWTKGEESGNHLDLVDIKADCDADTLLIRARPHGPTCHLGPDTCWGEKNEAQSPLSFLSELEQVIQGRLANPPENSYIARLKQKGDGHIARKFGEESTEMIVEALQNNRENLLEESADALFHYLVLLNNQGCDLSEVLAVLKARRK